jgi:hypothetical protein
MLIIPVFFRIISFLVFSKRLLLTLLVLEIMSFLVLGVLVSFCSQSVSANGILPTALFSIFVIEGVMALSGFIFLVNTTGSDSVGSNSLLIF